MVNHQSEVKQWEVLSSCKTAIDNSIRCVNKTLEDHFLKDTEQLDIGQNWRETTTTATSVLMSLSRLAGVGNFCFNMLSPFHSIVRILSSQAISFQIFLYAHFPRFPWSILLSFPWYFMLHDLTFHDSTIKLV